MIKNQKHLHGQLNRFYERVLRASVEPWREYTSSLRNERSGRKSFPKSETRNFDRTYGQTACNKRFRKSCGCPSVLQQNGERDLIGQCARSGEDGQAITASEQSSSAGIRSRKVYVNQWEYNTRCQKSLKQHDAREMGRKLVARPASPRLKTSTTMPPRALQTCTFDGPGASNTTKIPREDPQEMEERMKIVGRGKKKREILGPPFVRVRGPTHRAPPFAAPPFGPFRPLCFLGLGSHLLGRKTNTQKNPFLLCPRFNFVFDPMSFSSRLSFFILSRMLFFCPVCVFCPKCIFYFVPTAVSLFCPVCLFFFVPLHFFVPGPTTMLRFHRVGTTLQDRTRLNKLSKARCRQGNGTLNKEYGTPSTPIAESTQTPRARRYSDGVNGPSKDPTS